MLLLIGAAGNIGRQVAATLATHGQAYRALVRTPDQAAQLPGPAAPVYGEIGQAASLPAAMAGVETVYLEVPVTPRMGSQLAAVIVAARAAGVRRVVRLSGLGADPA